MEVWKFLRPIVRTPTLPYFHTSKLPYIKMRHLYTIAALVLLIFLLDLLFRPIYPEVDLIRATLVGLTAFAVLFAIHKLRPGLVHPVVGAVAIFASAFLSVLLIQAGVLVSQTTVSAVVHVLILVGAYFAGVLVLARRRPAVS